jgi:hypothetical protein
MPTNRRRFARRGLTLVALPHKLAVDWGGAPFLIELLPSTP